MITLILNTANGQLAFNTGTTVRLAARLLEAPHLRHYRGDLTGWPQLFVQGDQEGWFREIALQIPGTRT